jgi:hypothetical protein
MKRRLFNVLAICPAILCVGVCVLWVRSRSGTDVLAFMYCRYLPDKSITSDDADLTSNRDGVQLWLAHGHVPPRPPDLVRGYDVNADESHGRPRVWFNSEPYDPLMIWVYNHKPFTIFRSPVHLNVFKAQQPKDIADSRSISLGMSHWLMAALLLVMPVLWLKRFRDVRRAGRRGLCAKCGYDLRATPKRCPECGTPVRAR